MLRIVMYVLAAMFGVAGLARLFQGNDGPSLSGAWGVAFDLAWLLDSLLLLAAAAGWFMLGQRRGRRAAQEGDALTHAPSSGPAQGKSRARWVPAVSASLVTALVLVAMGWGLVQTGLSNAYSVTVVDQEARESTSHTEFTGTYSLASTNTYLCGDDEDYVDCLNRHVTLFNTVCVGIDLDTWGALQCDSLDGFVDDLREEYDRCGYGCRTVADDGTWGWRIFRLEAVTESVSSGNGLTRITHEEHCYFQLGSFTIGICPRSDS